jgi:pilus assembly protein FimV
MAEAAGLGRLVVFSALGQPLRAEVEVSATRQELADMTVRLASPEAFKQVGLDYATALLSMRFNLDKRPDGSAIIRLSSERPINDPFIDVLLELDWPTGRLVREYTFLLDPPEYAAKPFTAPSAVNLPAAVVPEIAAPQAAPASQAAPVPQAAIVAPDGLPIDNDVRARAIAQVRGERAAQTVQKPGSASRAGEGREVKRGDTLHRIAVEMKLEGVSLEQMLVGLFRANPTAFDGKNMNRLRVGAIIAMPERSALESVSGREARRIVAVQSSDWNAYRARLAGAAASSAESDTASQGASGKITAKVDDPAEQVPPGDQLKVARAGSGAGNGAASARASDEVAGERALKEANERVKLLEKNVEDMQRLIDIKDQRLNELEEQAAGAKPTESSPATVVPAAPVTSPASTPEAAPSTQPPETPAPAPEAAPPEAEPPPPAPPAPPVPPAPKPAPPEPRPAPPPPPEPSFFESLLDNTTMMLAGGGAIVALIAGFLFWRRRRALVEAEQELSSTLTSGSVTNMMDGNSVFRNTGGQSIDTSLSQGPAQTDFSQVGPGSIDTDEVDPVAEADVYMAYGRDAQAEEILLEARQKDPKRAAIAVKLLEVYSGRKDAKQFEALATDLYGETGGVGADWEKAAAMGRVLDPNNPIFHGTASGGAVKPVDGAPSVSAAAAAPAKASPQIGTFELDGGSAGSDLAPAADSPAGLSDIRLPEEPAAPAPENKVPDLDFDIGTKITPSAAVLDEAEARAQQATDIDFDLGAAPSVSQGHGKAGGNPGDDVKTDVQGSPATLGDDAVEFDVSLTESTFLGKQPPESPPSFDMSSINLDLQSPELEIADVEAPAPTSDAAKAPAQQEAETREDVQVSTAVVDPGLSAAHREPVITPPVEFIPQDRSDTAPNSDFGAERAETTQGVPGAPAAQAETAFDFDSTHQQTETNVGSPNEAMEEDPPASEFDIDTSNEVDTKLDLANAYEEMGDFEGARELLQEVLKEGNASQRETARNMLANLEG